MAITPFKVIQVTDFGKRKCKINVNNFIDRINVKHLTSCGTNRKPICDFLLVIIILTYTRRLTVPKLLQIIGQICAVDGGNSF